MGSCVVLLNGGGVLARLDVLEAREAARGDREIGRAHV